MLDPTTRSPQWTWAPTRSSRRLRRLGSSSMRPRESSRGTRIGSSTPPGNFRRHNTRSSSPTGWEGSPRGASRSTGPATRSRSCRGVRASPSPIPRTRRISRTTTSTSYPSPTIRSPRRRRTRWSIRQGRRRALYHRRSREVGSRWRRVGRPACMERCLRSGRRSVRDPFFR